MGHQHVLPLAAFVGNEHRRWQVSIRYEFTPGAENREHCNREGAEIPFDNILDRVTGSDPSVTDYILEAPAKCPKCRREILEKTLIEPA